MTVKPNNQQSSESKNNVILKAMVNNETNKVIFVESDNDFVDTLFSFLTIPMGSIIKHSHVGIGCLDNLYGSVESLDAKLFRTEECRDMLLHPRGSAETLVKNLKLKHDLCELPRYFKCPSASCSSKRTYSCYKTLPCQCGRLMDLESKFALKEGKGSGVFVKRPARFIISDDLQVLPPFTSEMSYLVTNHGFAGWNCVEEQTFDVGVDEVFNLLMRSLVSKTPLSDTLLKDKTLLDWSNENLNQEIHFESWKVSDKMNDVEEEKIHIKLIVSKSTRKVYYAEAGEDFVNLLLRFLTIPLGLVVKQMQGNSLKGCTDQLYQSVQDLDDQYLKSDYHKRTLLSLQLLPAFGYEKNPLGIEEASYKDVETVYIIEFTGPKSKKDDKARGFLKRQAMFMITDSLNVSPISAILGLSILSELNVPVTDIEVRVANVGKEEALRLLVAAFACDSALTNVFLAKPKLGQGLGCLKEKMQRFATN